MCVALVEVPGPIVLKESSETGLDPATEIVL